MHLEVTRKCFQTIMDLFQNPSLPIKKLVNATNDDKEAILAELIGKEFIHDTERIATVTSTEQFIHQLFPVDIRIQFIN